MEESTPKKSISNNQDFSKVPETPKKKIHRNNIDLSNSNVVKRLFH
uniref:Uncharacterized protein n=1 Tax=Pithovirus LCPAC104 TaxID=2506589 RepID=A0A481Z3V9_9VIRU|nr:MAG: hypothetical protein LCPAC104_00840 [Pithovirus LCPAC104]